MHRMHSPFHRLLVFASLLRVFASLFRVFASLLGVFASLLGVYGFEIFECFRKMALIALPVFAPADSPEQLVFGLIICFITFWNVHGECALSRANAHPVFPRSLVQSRPQRPPPIIRAQCKAVAPTMTPPETIPRVRRDDVTSLRRPAWGGYSESTTLVQL